MEKNIKVKPNSELLQKYFKRYGYWRKFCLEFYRGIAVPAVADEINLNGVETKITEFTQFKSILKKYNLDEELLSTLFIIIRILKVNLKDSQNWSWAKDLKRQLNFQEEMLTIPKLLAQFNNAYTVIPERNGIKNIKNYDTKRVINISLIRKGIETKYKFENIDIVSHIFHQLESYISEIIPSFETIVNQANLDELKMLTLKNKVNTSKKNNELLAIQRRLAKASYDLIANFNLKLSQNQKYMLVGRMFELGGLLQNEKIFNQNIAPTTNYKSIGVRSKSNPYEKFLQQNIKKFIYESD